MSLNFRLSDNFLRSEEDVERRKDDEELHSTVGASEHEDYVRIFSIKFAGRKHEREHDKHFVDRHDDE